MELTDSEKNEAKNNGFILVGKTGAGKTTLLNAVFNKVVGKVERSAKSVTKVSSVYYYKSENGKCLCFIDTPGLSDSEATHNKDIDLIHLNGISKTISDEKIHIKGILFLVNFQNERFDASEQAALLNYNKIFPLKRFWKHLIIIYTHFFVDPYEDETEEDMKLNKKDSNKEIFSNIMEKIKDVSDVIEYDNLKIKYFNSFSDPKNNKQKSKNNENRIELQKLLNDLTEAEPLFNQIEIENKKNYKWEENGKKYFGEIEIIRFFDLNEEPIKEITNIIHKEEVREMINIPPTSYSCNVYNANYSSNGRLSYSCYSGNSSNTNKKHHTVLGSLATLSLFGPAGLLIKHLFF